MLLPAKRAVLWEFKVNEDLLRIHIIGEKFPEWVIMSRAFINGWWDLKNTISRGKNTKYYSIWVKGESQIKKVLKWLSEHFKENIRQSWGSISILRNLNFSICWNWEMCSGGYSIQPFWALYKNNIPIRLL